MTTPEIQSPQPALQIGDTIVVNVKQPHPGTIRMTLATPESVAYANELIADPTSGWTIEPEAAIPAPEGGPALTDDRIATFLDAYQNDRRQLGDYEAFRGTARDIWDAALAAQPQVHPDGTVNPTPQTPVECSVCGGLVVGVAPAPAEGAQAAPERYSPDGEGGMEIDSLGDWVKFRPTGAPAQSPAEGDAPASTKPAEAVQAALEKAQRLVDHYVGVVRRHIRNEVSLMDRERAWGAAMDAIAAIAALAAKPQPKAADGDELKCDGCGKTIAQHDAMLRCHPQPKGTRDDLVQRLRDPSISGEAAKVLVLEAADALAQAPAPAPEVPRPFTAVKSFSDSVLAMLDERIKTAEQNAHPFKDYFGDHPETIVAAKAQASELREVRTQVRILGDRALVDLMKFRPATSAPAVGAGDERQDVGGHIRAAANARVAQQADDDTRRLDYLQKKQATISLVPDGRDEKGTRHAFMVGGWHCSVNRDVRASIDAAMGESHVPVQGRES